MEPDCGDCPVLKTSFFRDVPYEQIRSMGRVFRRAHYRRNQVLYTEGTTAEHLFALHSGLIKMVKTSAGGEERISGVIFPGELFGLESLTDSRYPVTAIALGDCEICAAPREEFASYVRTNPDAAVGMVRFMVKELDRIRTHVTDMSFKDARMKLATFLLSLVGSGSHADGGTVNILLPLSRQEISEILELSPETVSRTLGAFRREQLLTARGRRLIIQNRPGLEAIIHR
jgi:CRP-like cAMP-binding protein